MSVHIGMHIYTYSLYDILGKYKYIFYQAPLLLFIHKILFYDRYRSRSERSELKYSNFSYLLCFLSFLDLQFSSKAQIALRKVLKLQLHVTVEVLPVTQSLPSNLLILLIPSFPPTPQSSVSSLLALADLCHPSVLIPAQPYLSKKHLT